MEVELEPIVVKVISDLVSKAVFRLIDVVWGWLKRIRLRVWLEPPRPAP